MSNGVSVEHTGFKGFSEYLGFAEVIANGRRLLIASADNLLDSQGDYLSVKTIESVDYPKITSVDIRQVIGEEDEYDVYFTFLESISTKPFETMLMEFKVKGEIKVFEVTLDNKDLKAQGESV